MSKSKGRFIVIEGLDGSGKTTAAKKLVEKLSKSGRAYYTKEPSDGDIGKWIRKNILESEGDKDNDLVALMFAADRLDHINNEILPLIFEGVDVICDRYYYSNLAYQGDITNTNSIFCYNSKAYEILNPDFVFFIDTPIDICLERISNREKVEIYETKEKLESVRELYLKSFDIFFSGLTYIIDGEQSKNEIVDNMMAKIKFWELIDSESDIVEH